MAQVNITELVERLRALRKRRFDESPALFWADYINISKTLCMAQSAEVLVLSVQQRLLITPEPTTITDSFNQPVSVISPPVEAVWLQELMVRALKNGFAIHHEQIPLQDKWHWLCFRLATEIPRVLLLKVDEAHSERLGDIVLRAQLLADVPTEQGATTAQIAAHATDALSLLSILPDVYAAKSLSLAGYTLVNGLVTSADTIDLASLGWLKGEYVKIENISHFDGFEKKTELVKLYEAALEEAVDQQAVIHLAAKNEFGLIRLAHEQLQRAMACDDLASLVIFDAKGQPMGAILLVKMSGQFSADSLNAINFMLSLLSARLDFLRQQDGGIWLKTKQTTRQLLSVLFGKEWLWTKLSMVTISVLAIWLLFGSLSFRIEANGEFITDRTQLLSAPQDGVVVSVAATVGDTVVQGQPLIQFKKQDLVLQLTELGAERQRYASEEDKARASNNIIETEIAKARKSQVEARIARVELMLTDTEVRAPFDGVVIEGERKNLLGLPARKGETLMKIARIEDIYLTILVDERDIHHILHADTGEFALVSQPLSPLPFQVEQVIPIAYGTGQKGAQFKIKARLQSDAQTWWRPGMTGVAKIDKGDAPPYWVLGRKAYHQLRLLLWW